MFLHSPFSIHDLTKLKSLQSQRIKKNLCTKSLLQTMASIWFQFRFCPPCWPRYDCKVPARQIGTASCVPNYILKMPKPKESTQVYGSLVSSDCVGLDSGHNKNAWSSKCSLARFLWFRFVLGDGIRTVVEVTLSCHPIWPEKSNVPEFFKSIGLFPSSITWNNAL